MRTHVARVNRTTGELDPGWNVTTDKTVRDMVLVGTTLYLVGDFTKVNGTARKRAAAVSTAARPGTLDPNFHPSLTNKVYTVAAGGGNIYFGGNFTSVTGTARSFLAAVNASDGALIPAVYSGITARCSTSPSRATCSTRPPMRGSTGPRRGTWTAVR